MPKIFISHAVKDAEQLVQPFVDLLILGLKIDRDEIYYTSGGDIPTGSNFPNHIRDNIITAELVILFLTDNYMNSHFCLNEMGAVWANNQSIYPIAIPPASHQILDRTALGSGTNVLTIKHANDLAKLRDEMASKKLTGNNLRSAEYNVRCENFIKVVNDYIKQRADEEPLTVPAMTYMKLQNELDKYKNDLRDKIDECDTKNDLIEELKKLKDQSTVKKVMHAHNSSERDQFAEILEDTKGALSSLSNMMLSLLYHYTTFNHHFRPGSDEWSEITSLVAKKFISHDDGEFYINKSHPILKEPIRLLNLLNDAIEGMSEEVYDWFVEEYNIEPDLSNYDFWSSVLEISGLSLSSD